MLSEAVESVLNQTHKDLRCIVYDDGSDIFDIEEWAKNFDDDRIAIVGSGLIPPEERIRPGNTQWSTNMNSILARLPEEEYILYLCDDDILHPEWLELLNHRYEASPGNHVLLGDMYYFQDGEDPLTQGKKGFPAAIPSQDKQEEEKLIMWWMMGAFCHSMICFHKEGVKWRKGYMGYAHSWDIQYIEAVQRAHMGYLMLPFPAVYRREHEKTMSAKLGRINEDGLYFKAGEELSIESITSAME